MTITDYSTFISELEVLGAIAGKTIDFGERSINISSRQIRGRIEFIDCHIIANKLNFKNIKNRDLDILFRNCILDCNLNVTGCSIGSFDLYDIQSITSLSFMKDYDSNDICEIDRFSFYQNDKSEIELSTEFYFKDCHFVREFRVNNLKQIGGSFILVKNKFNQEDFDRETYSNYQFINTHFHNLCFQQNFFHTITLFYKCWFSYNELENKKYKNTLFWGNSFNKIAFNDCIFEQKTVFELCDFKGTTYFENNKNSNASLYITECRFTEYTSFDNSIFKYFEIKKSVFENTISFQDTSSDLITIDKPSFEKIAYFDNIQIRDINKCDRRTLRNIKQQLQKAENRIDYNRFRAYEIAAYYQELDWKWSSGFKDKVILWATKHVTGFDHSWRKALRFILLSAFGFFTLFFISENYALQFYWSGIPQYITGYFRFLLVTDFYNPLIQSGREYIDNDGWNHIASWFFFILGKIVIAFGIYEMIQAFRKFKA